MRLKSVYISDYKNLKDFSLNFDGGSFIDVFVGKNGSGKSNLFEALIEIFRHLYEYDKPKEACKFGYRVCFSIDDADTTIEWKDDKLTINGKERKTIGETPLPDNVLIYYSGHNNTVAQLVTDYEESFRKRIKKAESGESRPFIGIGSDYKELLLSVLLMQPEGSKARQFIFDKLGIKQIVPVVNIILQRPHFADAKLEFEEFDPKSHFWGIEGITRDFLDDLMACIKGEFSHKDLYNAESKTYNLAVDMELLHAKLGSKITSVFHLFDNLKMLGMLSQIWVPIIQNDDPLALRSHFSDGQFQSVYIYAIMEIFKDRNCITLLDEPDAFLHPEWQFGFLKQVFEITDTTAKNNHVLMSSHSASTITKADEGIINLLEFDGDKVTATKATKGDVIKSLSAGLISFSESEARLNIQHVLKNTTKPILFTEGVSDVVILETAWSKLFPHQDIKFEIQGAFCRSILQGLFSRDDLKTQHPNRLVFGLFDFDEAYGDWNRLEGTDEISDPMKGLCRKLSKHPMHFTLLIPVPDADKIKKLALDSKGKPWKRPADCHLSIELLFHSDPQLAKWFEEEESSGGGCIIQFKGDKVKFAEDVVKKLSPSHFEIFRPMFEFIQSKCSSAVVQTNAVATKPKRARAHGA